MLRGLAGVALFSSVACSGLLDVSDPTLIRDGDIATAAGANARRVDVMVYLNNTAPQLAEDVAFITDEWTLDYQFDTQVKYLDLRDSEGYEQALETSDPHLGQWDQVYYQTSIALPAVRAYSPDSVRREFLGQLYAIRGYAVLQIAEDICPGFPLNDVSSDNRPLFSGPLTTDSALVIANHALDSAVANAHDTTRFVTLARVAKGRALLDQGKYAEAAAVVAPVVTSSVYVTDGSNNTMYYDVNPTYWDDSGYGVNIAMGDSEGGNGMPFSSANDPRTPRGIGGRRWADSTDTLYKSNRYPSPAMGVPLATGIEARLIEAEAALHAGDASWLIILNSLRATMVSPALPALTDPGTADARVDLVYRERAFWLYNTGRRLGDLRRLIKNYGRAPETVFPTGHNLNGGNYGTATAIPFILASQQQSNPYITTGCTTR